MQETCVVVYMGQNKTSRDLIVHVIIKLRPCVCVLTHIYSIWECIYTLFIIHFFIILLQTGMLFFSPKINKLIKNIFF